MRADIRNRVVRHVRVRAGDLVPHELNPRAHPRLIEVAGVVREVDELRPHRRVRYRDVRIKRAALTRAERG